MARIFVTRLVPLALAGMAAVSCTITAKGSGAYISKVKNYLLETTTILKTTDQTVLFERQYRLHGAVTAAEQIARTGCYYTVMWGAKDRTQPMTVRFEFRQEKTALAVKKLEQEVATVRKHNVTEFKVVGQDFTDGGRVTAWRVTLLRGKEELVSQNSYLWK